MTCLAKDPDERFQTAHDVKLDLQWVARAGARSAVAARSSAVRSHADRVARLLLVIMVLLAAAGGTLWWIQAHQTPPAMFFNSSVSSAASGVALSPDGRVLAMVTYSEQANKNMIWTQMIGGRGANAVPGTEGASHPFWSPDGRSVGFFSQGELKKVDINSGRSAQVLCDAPHGGGGTWNRDGVILFSSEGFAGLYRVASGGGAPTRIKTFGICSYLIANQGRSSRPAAAFAMRSFHPMGAS
jgi:hypothetical protein